MTLEETIKKLLAEAAQPTEVKAEEVVAENKAEEAVVETTEVVAETTEAVAEEKESCGAGDEVDMDPKKDKKKKTEMKKMSEEVNALLDTEGLSEDFKLKASTIFEAAVAEKAIQIEEEVEAKYAELFESEKQELISNIDGYLNEAVQTWIAQNEIAIQQNFRSQVAESFMDGLAKLLAEHNVAIPEEAEDVLEVALEEAEKLEESLQASQETISALQEEINSLKAEKILESYKGKMTDTEFDRFSQLVESFGFEDEAQYTKQLNIVLENFGSTKKAEATVITEEVQPQVETKVLDESIAKYAEFIQSKKNQTF